MAPCTSTPPKPASTALRAAVAKSATVAAISSVGSSRGVTGGGRRRAVKILSGNVIGEGATGTSPLVSGCPFRPPCFDRRNVGRPTARVARRQPAT